MIARRDTVIVAERTSHTMRSNRSKDTKPEVALRKALWAKGIRGYRKHASGLPGRPDLVFGRYKLAVFVHGCYWHRCPVCQRDRAIKTNRDFWHSKLTGNADRDVANKKLLEDQGYRVLVIWECQLKADLEKCVDIVRQAFP